MFLFALSTFVFIVSEILFVIAALKLLNAFFSKQRPAKKAWAFLILSALLAVLSYAGYMVFAIHALS